MKKTQKGFTLVEMVMVVVVVGTLSAVAVPKYIDYKESAGVATVKGIAASLGSAAANNYSAVTSLVPSGVTMLKCKDLKALLTGGLPDGIIVDPVADGDFDGNGVVATMTAPDKEGTASVIFPAKMGTCKVSSDKFKAFMTFPYTPIAVPI